MKGIHKDSLWFDIWCCKGKQLQSQQKANKYKQIPVKFDMHIISFVHLLKE